jgi:hypothetical protein
MHAALTILVSLVFMIFMDRTLPQSVRTFSPGILPWGDPVKVAAFNRAYGLVRFPRTLFAAGAVAAMALPSGPDDLLVLLPVAFVILWGIAAMFDIYRAGRTVH